MTLTYAMTASVLFIGLTIILVDATDKLKTTDHRKVSLILIGATMFYIAMDWLWIVEYSSETFHRGLFILLNFLFYLVYITLPYIWFRFARHFAEEREMTRKWKILLAVPWMINLALVLLTMLGTDLLWHIGDAAERYTRGPLFDVFTNLNLFYYFLPVAAIIYLLITGKGAERKTLLTVLGFSLVPALSVFIYTFWISVDAIYPFQPCCFFLGVLFAYILLVTDVYEKSEDENIRLQEETRSAAKMAEMMGSVAELLTNLPAMTFSKDVETGVYLACSQSFAKYVSKKSPDEVVGLTDYDLFDRETADHIVRDDKKALDLEEAYVFAEAVPDTSGAMHNLQTTKLTFQDPSGRLCMLGMCVDITEMTRLKEVQARTSFKNEFLANISHDIRTPMNAIVGYTNIAKEQINDPDGLKETLAKIGSSSHFLLSLINDILDISRIERGELQLNPRPCDLSLIFRRIEDITSLQAQSKDLDIRYEKSSVRHIRVIADVLRIEQLLINIITNAIKYTPEGGEVDLIAEELGPGGPGKIRYRFTIRDTGVGISEDYLPHLFDQFTREQRTTINRVQGSGLGLAITAKIVELMGGTISVKSKVGEGSAFTVELELETLEEAGEAAGAEKGAENKLSGKHILIVEDNDVNAEIAAMVLEQYGVRTERAENGSIGADMVREKKNGAYDAVLMDIQMPVMNGLESTREIRTFDREIPILAVSANAFEEDVRACLDAGMNAHLAKPFQPEDLVKMLEMWLRD